MTVSREVKGARGYNQHKREREEEEEYHREDEEVKAAIRLQTMVSLSSIE